MIFKNSTVTATCAGGMWGGIRVWGNNDREQPDVWVTVGNQEQLNYNVPVTSDDAGMVLFDTGTKITRARRVVATRSDAVPYPIQVDRRGGLVAAKGAYFIDNRRIGEFIQYPRPSGGHAFANKTRFVNCLFKETSDQITTGTAFTIWDTDGITFDQCTFREFDYEAILVQDAIVNITSGNTFFKSEEFATGGHFRVISASATYPFSGGLNIGVSAEDPNVFNYAVRRGAMIHSYGQNSYEATNITNSEFKSLYVGRSPISADAIYLEGTADYDINDNVFLSEAVRVSSTGTPIGSAFDTGIGIMNTGGDELANFSRIRCNYFDDYRTGITASDLNDFTEILSNDFAEANWAIQVRDKIKKNQGNLNRPAGNCFDPTVNTRIKVSNNTTVFTYYIDEQLIPCELPESSLVYEVKETEKMELNCSQNRPPLPPSGSKETIKQTRANALAKLNGNPSNEQYKTEYEEANLVYSNFFRGMINKMLLGGNIIEAINYAAEIQTSEFPYELFGTYMQVARYDDAETMLNTTTLTDKKTMDFKSIQEINLQYLRDTATYLLSPKDFEKLDALSLEGTVNSGYAKGLMLLVAGHRYSVPGLKEDTPKTSLSTILNAEKVLIYPNPARSAFFVEFPDKVLNGESANIQVISTVGRIVYEATLTGPSRIHNVSLSGIGNGTYFVRVKMASNSQYLKKISVIK